MAWQRVLNWITGTAFGEEPTGQSNSGGSYTIIILLYHDIVLNISSRRWSMVIKFEQIGAFFIEKFHNLITK